MSRHKATLRESTFDRLKTLIISGELQPEHRLTEADLAARLNVSRTPIREALNRLERDGLVTSRPRQGYLVAPLDIAALEEALAVREILDGYAADEASGKISEDEKASLREIIRTCDAMGPAKNLTTEELAHELRLGLKIHHIIAQSTGNRFLSDTLSKIMDRIQHFIWLELLWLDEWEIARDEHREIVEAVCSRDGKRAAKLAREHVSGSRENILRILKARDAHRAAMQCQAWPGAMSK